MHNTRHINDTMHISPAHVHHMMESCQTILLLDAITMTS